MIPYNSVVEASYSLSVETLYGLRKDIFLVLDEAHQVAQEPEKTYISTLIRNAVIAKRQSIFLFHEIGMPCFLLEIGEDVQISGNLRTAIEEGVTQAHFELPIRDRILLDPFSPEDVVTSGISVPIHVEYVSGSQLKISCIRLSQSSEQTSQINVLPDPFQGGLISEFVMKAVSEASCSFCPPFVLGVGIGSTLDQVGILAKKALIRPVGKPHPVLEYARLEQDLLQAINTLSIGAGGLGGELTALSVHVETLPAYFEAVPIAIYIQNCNIRGMERILDFSDCNGDSEMDET